MSSPAAYSPIPQISDHTRPLKDPCRLGQQIAAPSRRAREAWPSRRLSGPAADLAGRGDTEAAATAVGIAAQPGCQPLLDCAATTRPARPRTAAS
jgi:hypothetical protein